MISAANIDNEEQAVLHFGAIRVRVTGNGNLIPTFYNLDQDKSQQLVPIPITSSGGREIVKLANFKSQRAFLKLETTQLNEVMKINRVVVFVKPLWTEYPE